MKPGIFSRLLPVACAVLLGLPQLAAAGCVFADLSAGFAHTCGLRLNGTVQCWGDNKSGQASPPPEPFASIVSGAAHSCGLRSDGTVGCWGDNTYSQSAAPPGAFRQIAAGFWHTCGLKPDGQVVCWGDDSLTQLSPPQDDAYETIAAGGFQSCGLRGDGTIGCWGDSVVYGNPWPPGKFESLAIGAFYGCAQRSNSTVVCWRNEWSREELPPPAEPLTTYTAHAFGACGVTKQGETRCWGLHALDDPVPPEGTFVRVSGGGSHVCGLRPSGVAECWGYNRAAQATPPGLPFIALSRHCGLRRDRSIECWGSYVFGDRSPIRPGPYVAVSGSCGLGADGSVDCGPGNAFGEALAPPGSIVALSASTYGACGMRPDSTLQCWGLSLEGFDLHEVEVVRVSAGDFVTCAILTDGTIRCWGQSEFGEADAPAGAYVELAAGIRGQHSCAIRRNASVRCWGPNEYPEPPPAGSFSQVSATGWTSCGLRTTGEAECWGDDYWGHASPPPGTFVSVSTGGVQSPHYDLNAVESCGLRPNGSIECWGQPAEVLPACRSSLRCGQPVSGETNVFPVASDALSILRSAVGTTSDCAGQPCICDVNESGSVTIVDALVALRASVEGHGLGCSCAGV